MPSRIAGSFSMQTTSAPLIGVCEIGVVAATAAVWLTLSATGTVTEKMRAAAGDRNPARCRG